MSREPVFGFLRALEQSKTALENDPEAMRMIEQIVSQSEPTEEQKREIIRRLSKELANYTD